MQLSQITNIAAYFLSDALSYLNLIFLAELPIGVLYLQDIWGPLASGLYLALYGILSRFSNPDSLASRLAVFDSIFTVMGKTDSLHYSSFITYVFLDEGIIGTLVSAPLFNAVGYYGVYAINSFLNLMALIYTIFVVKNYPVGYTRQKKDTREETTDDKRSWLQSNIIQPLRDLFGTLLRKRPRNMRTILFINLFAMMMYYTTSEVGFDHKINLLGLATDRYHEVNFRTLPSFTNT